MFKLKKIFNKHNNAPELEKYNADYNTFTEPNFVYYLNYGYLSYSLPEGYDDEKILYISCSRVEEFNDDKMADCFRITPDMIFETTCPTGSTPHPGDKFILKQAESKNKGFESVQRVENTEESDGFFVNTDNWNTTKKVLIRFHCKQ